MNYDIITFGSATRDTFLRLKKENYRILDEGELSEGQSLCFPLGSKIFIEDLNISTGGGATNTAVTFTRQGFKVAVCSKVGHDKRGEAVTEELKKFQVASQFIKKDKKHPTAYSAVLSCGSERTILIYRGACHFMKEEDIPFLKLKAKWFYLAPLSEESAKIFKPLVNFAATNRIKIAANPGNTQINLSQDFLKPILQQLDVLILNREEASWLAGLRKNKEMEIIKKLIGWMKGILVITKGKEGSVVCDGRYLYQASTPSVLPLEKTGAGDAYGAGFLAGLIQKNDIKYAMQLATANATSCIQKIGAKNGLLKKGQWGTWPRVEVGKRSLAP